MLKFIGLFMFLVLMLLPNGAVLGMSAVANAFLKLFLAIGMGVVLLKAIKQELDMD